MTDLIFGFTAGFTVGLETDLLDVIFFTASTAKLFDTEKRLYDAKTTLKIILAIFKMNHCLSELTFFEQIFFVLKRRFCKR